MDQPTDPLVRQLALRALTTEHFNLQAGRPPRGSPSGDMVVGSDITLEDRGTHPLKGVQGSWQLFAVVNR